MRFGPSDRTGVEGFLRDVPVEETPLGAFVEGMRKQNEEKERMVEEGRREEDARKTKEGKGGARDSDKADVVVEGAEEGDFNDQDSE